MGESTDYTVLTIVGLVGLVAIVAMMDVSFEFTAPDSSLAGAATSVSSSLLDYDGDGALTVEDQSFLADAIALQNCPGGVVCDVDRNFVLDDRDLAAFNEFMASPLTGNVVSQPTRSVIVGYSSVTTTLA